MGLIDLIVIVLVVVAVVTRFTKFKLPKDTRDRTARRGELDRLRGRPLVRDDEPVDITPVAEVKPAKPKPAKLTPKDVAHLSGLAKLKALEPAFEEAAFLEGAKAAYRYFYDCWNAKDEEGMDNLCAPALFDRLARDMHDAAWAEVKVDDITSATVGTARVHGKTAIVDVNFETREREGGAAPRPVRRRWVLARPLGSDDPNWELQDVVTVLD